MAIIQISKLQQRSGNLVDLPQLDEAEFGWASDEKKLFIGKTTPNENVEILTSYSTINFDAIAGSYGNLAINPNTAQNGQVLAFSGFNWVNRGGNSGGLINLGDIANLKILGGGIGYILETDGTGNLSWTPKGTLISFIENAVPAKMPLNQTFATDTFAANGNITLDNVTGYVIDTPIVFTGTGFGNISANTLYYVNAVSGLNSTIKISTSLGGPAISLTDASGNIILNVVGTLVTTTQDNFFTNASDVTITDAVGMTQLNGNSFYIDVISSNTFGLYLNSALDEPLYSNNYNSYAYTSVTATDSATSVITVGDTTDFSVNGPVVFKGSLGTSDLVAGNTYYINAIVSGTEFKVSTYLWPNGVAGNVFPVDTDLTIFNSIVYQEGGRIISELGGASSTQASGSNTTVQFNYNNILDGDADFTFDFGTTPKLLTLNGNANVGNLVSSGLVSGTQLISNVPTLTGPPLSVVSTTRVSNLNVSYSNVSDFEVVTTQTTGVFYPVFVSGNTTANYALGSNSNLSFNSLTGNLSTTILNANGNINANNAVITNQTRTSNLLVTGNINTPSWGSSGIAIRTTSNTYTDTSTLGDAILPATHINVLQTPSIDTSNGNVTISNAATLFIAGAPSNASTNVTISNSYAVMVNAGNVLINANADINNVRTTSIFNGNSSIRITANGNIVFYSASNTSARATLSSSSLTLNGALSVANTLSVSGNSNVANIASSQRIIGPIYNITGNVNGNSNVSTIVGNLGLRAISSTYTDNVLAASTTVDMAAVHALGRPTVASSNANTTANNYSTFYIQHAPLAGNNVTIGNAYSLYVANGTAYFGSNLIAANLFGIIRPTSGNGTAGILFPDNPGGNTGDTASIKYYAYSGDDCVLDLTVTDNANDYIRLNAPGGTTIENSLQVNGSATVSGSLTVSNIAIITTGNISTINTNVIQNGNSNLAIPSPNGNVTISVTGVTNVATYTSNRLIVTGNIETSTGAMIANGSIIANGNISGGNLSITTNTTTGSLTTATITAPTSNITISAAGTNESIFLQPTGTGVVSVGGKRITQVGSVTTPSDATNKEYVDAIAGTGLTIHNPANLARTTNLAGTYTVGGTVQTTTTISSGSVITFNAVHGLSVNDGIVWTNSFNGIIGGEAYFVDSVPSATQITIKDAYFGAILTTLTNGTGLTQPSRANPGVGATLTNSGANTALIIDGVTVSAAQRVLLLGQTTSAENGLYAVTNPGNASVAWILTRSTDMNKYIPGSSQGMGSGDYVFVTQGTTNFGTSWVLGSPTGEIIIGTDSVLFSQFSSAGAYQSGNGINISGTIISANTDGTTTGIVGGNIVVVANAALTTPNIGAATGTSLVLSGNVTANNISVTNLGNIGGNITTSANVLANINVVANGNISGNNLSATNGIVASGNMTGANVITTNYFIRSVQTGISANGSNLSTATGLSKEINVVSTVTSGTGVRLPIGVAGMGIIVTNTSANSLNVYPNANCSINFLAANAVYSMPAKATLQFVAPTTTQWYTVGATYA